MLPNVVAPLTVEFGLRLTFSIGLIASLDYLGLGVQPPKPDWGPMIQENQSGLTVSPWPVLIAGPARSRCSPSAATWSPTGIARPCCRHRPEGRRVSGRSFACRAPCRRPRRAPTRSSKASTSRLSSARCSGWSASRARARRRSPLALLGYARPGMQLQGSVQMAGRTWSPHRSRYAAGARGPRRLVRAAGPMRVAQPGAQDRHAAA